jgi:hypothetical protein
MRTNHGKRSLLALLAAVLLLPASSFALGVGGPGRDLELGKTSLGAGFSYSSYQLDKVDCANIDFSGKFAFGVAPGVTPYFRLGFSTLSIGSEDGTLGFAYGGGVLLRLMAPPSPDGLSLLTDLQVMRGESEVGGGSFTHTRIQGALFGSLRSGGTTTYGGVAATSYAIDAPGPDPSSEVKTHLFFGLDYFVDFSFYLNAEAHLFGEDTVSLGVGYLF